MIFLSIKDHNNITLIINFALIIIPVTTRNLISIKMYIYLYLFITYNAQYMANNENIINLEITREWKDAFPGASVGVLVMRNTVNPKNNPDLDNKMKGIEDEIRNNFSESGREGIRGLPTIRSYTEYYKKFKKTYHVMLQLESIALKNRNLPRISALVSAMFAAELKNQLLTAGHDISKLQRPIVLNIATGNESYTGMNGKVQNLNPDDMFISDNVGVISSIIYGPDNRTPITSDTTDVMFTVYGPAGISTEQIKNHLEDISSYVKLVSSDAVTDILEIYSS